MNEAYSSARPGFHEQLVCDLLSAGDIHRDDRFALDNILSGQTYYRKSFFDQPLSDLSFYMTILDGGASGFAYHNGSPSQGDQVRGLIDKNAIEVLCDGSQIDFPLRVSILDAAYGEFNKLTDRDADQAFSLSGGYEEKANFRSHLVTEQLGPGRKVLLVGLVTEFVRDMIAKDIEVCISDMSPELKGKEVYGVPVVNGGNEWTLGQLATCDAAVVTGSSFASNTIDSILNTAKAYNTDLHFYLETGSNFAPRLIDHGVKSVIAERFPFYDMPGETVFEVHHL